MTGGRSSISGIVATVFGANGFIGRYVVGRLGRSGSQVVAPYRCHEDEVRRLKVMGDLGQISAVPFDATNGDELRELMAHSNVVINLIGKDWETRNFNYTTVHRDIPAAIAEAVADSPNVEHFVHFSHAGVAAPAGTSRVWDAKREGEEAVKAAVPDVTVVRPNMVFGPEDRVFNMLAVMARKYPFVPLVNGGNTRWAPVYVKDVVAGVMEVLADPAQWKGKTVSLHGPQVLTHKDVLADAAEVMKLQRGLNAIPIPTAVMAAAGSFYELLPKDPLFVSDTAAQFACELLPGTDGNPGFAELGINASDFKSSGLTFLRMWRDGNQYGEV